MDKAEFITLAKNLMMETLYTSGKYAAIHIDGINDWDLTLNFVRKGLANQHDVEYIMKQ